MLLTREVAWAQVGNAQIIIPANDVSEHISTAGTEASGTSNMKFVMNGGLIVGTDDGANIEIKENVGEENIFIFGLTADEVRRRKEQGNRVPPGPLLAEVLQSLRSGFFTESEPEDLFRPLCDSLLHDDRYMLLDDFDSYCRVQDQAGELFTDEDSWTRKTIYNVAAMGRFSSDRTISEYAGDIWNIPSSRAGS